tara:strand:- start:1860 stop:2120 length:261 start_codon:yes stop_codon:yes gene_type:complete
MTESNMEIYKRAYYIFMTYTCIGAFFAFLIILAVMYAPNDGTDSEIGKVKETINSSPKALLYVFFTITYCYPIFIGEVLFGKKKKE